MFWHKIKNICILSYTGRHFRLGAMSGGLIFNLGCIYGWRLLLLCLVTCICSCLFNCYITIQLLENNLICFTVENQDTFLFCVVTLISFENCIRHSRSICRVDIRWALKIQWIKLPKCGTVTVTWLFDPVSNVASLCASTLAGLKSSVIQKCGYEMQKLWNVGNFLIVPYGLTFECVIIRPGVWIRETCSQL